PEAVRLVIQAGAMAQGGEIFILDMGEPVKIMDLAEKVIRLSGYEPHIDIDIEITGLRPGEKLYEELLLSEEGIKETTHEKIFVGHPISISPALADMLKTENGFADTVNIIREMTEKQAKAWLKKVVPNYTETPNGKGEDYE
ncbi:MAG: polysaccharide biosynthesis protein, partial [Candidatus Moranbacteria bacterium]|nr:polysaccharide biosynthesis protein [Candidatus Moranbacteria bacterium]